MIDVSTLNEISGEVNMQEQIKTLLQNEEVVTRMSKATSPEESYEIVQSYGITLSFEEYKAVMTELLHSLVDESDGVLSEADLQALAGGVDVSKELKDAAVAIGIAATAIATASTPLIIIAVAAIAA